jgi:hypothetical protein
MGNQTGSASGGAAASQGQQGMMAGGMNMMQQGGNQQDMLLTKLAQMGPPPMMNTAGAPTAGQDIVGKYKGGMKPPSVNYRSRLGNQLDPSVGQMLTGAM